MPPSTLQQRVKFLRAPMQVTHAYGALRASNPDVCLVFGEDIGSLVTILARFAGVPRTVVFPRGTPSRSIKGVTGRLNAIGYRVADRVVVQTDAMCEALTSRFRGATCQTIGNPIEIPAQCRKMSEREKWILHVGSMGRQKNQAALIRAFANLPESDGWQLIFVGDGPDRSNLQAVAAATAVGNRVQFVGEQADVFQWLNQARIFAFPSLSEGFPNALAEALAAGCACISYDCPTGPADLIENNHNGLLVPNAHEPALQEGLHRLISNSVLQERLSMEARRRIKQFSSDVILAKLETTIAEVLGPSVAKRSNECAS